MSSTVRINRRRLYRSLALTVVAAGVLTACGADDEGTGDAGAAGDGESTADEGDTDTDATAEMQTIQTTVTHFPAGGYTPPYAVGMDEGIFADHGIEIEGIIPGAGGGTSVRNLLTGDLEFGEVALPAAVDAYLAGAPIVIVGGGTRTWAEAAYVTRPDEDDINELEDLIGKRVGFTNPGSVTETASFLFADSIGVDRDEFDWFAAGGVQEGLTLLEAGDLDAAVISEPQHTSEVNEGRWKTVFRNNEYLPALQQTVIVTSPQIVEENPELIEAYLAAYEEAVNLIYENPEVGGQAWARAGEFDEDISTTVVEELVDARHWDVAPDIEGINFMLSGMLQGGLISEGAVIDWDDLINDSFLPGGQTVDIGALDFGEE